jgi:hypothetical protein
VPLPETPPPAAPLDQAGHLDQAVDQDEATDSTASVLIRWTARNRREHLEQLKDGAYRRVAQDRTAPITNAQARDWLVREEFDVPAALTAALAAKTFRRSWRARPLGQLPRCVLPSERIAAIAACMEILNELPDGSFRVDSSTPCKPGTVLSYFWQVKQWLESNGHDVPPDIKAAARRESQNRTLQPQTINAL